MPESAKFWDRMANRYSKQPVADNAAYQKKLQMTRAYFQPDTEVLEFGCGTGTTAISHAPYVKHILATDISAKMIAIARKKAEAGNIGNVAFKCLPFSALDIPDDSLDVVLGLSILHLLDDRKKAIAKAHAMLKTGGIFVSSTACIGEMAAIFKVLAMLMPVGRGLGLMPLVKIFTAQELAQTMTDAGFKIIHQWQPGKNKAVFIVAQKAE